MAEHVRVDAKVGANPGVKVRSLIAGMIAGADDIDEAGSHGLRRGKWADLELVGHWRRYLDNPDSYLRHILDQ